MVSFQSTGDKAGIGFKVFLRANVNYDRCRRSADETWSLSDLIEFGADMFAPS